MVILMVVLGEYTKTRGRMLLTAVMFSAYFFVSVGPVWSAQRGGGQRIHRLALAAGAVAMLLLLAGVWGTPNSDAFWKSAAIVTVLALVLAYLSLLDREPGALARGFAVKAVAAATLLVCVGIAAGITWPPYWWVFTLSVIVWLGALAGTPAIWLAKRLGSRIQAR
ncbi:MAG: hypothetical protein O3A93_02020 [Chloroflexi bacterium]|nr:hypothetical protein [Chloroflexota bacterium]MDA1270024.1 hypothetical protein [Chloroflexota bacterium]